MGTKGLPRNWNASMHRPAEVPASRYLSRCNALQLIQAAVAGFNKSQLVFARCCPLEVLPQFWGVRSDFMRWEKRELSWVSKRSETMSRLWTFLVQRERITGCYPADFSFCWIPDVCKWNTVRCTLSSYILHFLHPLLSDTTACFYTYSSYLSSALYNNK